MKPVVGIFAHPDDEAFGPSGTLAKFAQEGHDVYLICVTKGDAGDNHTTKKAAIQNIREEELLASVAALGLKKVFFLGFNDGTLSNNIYHDVANKLELLLKKLEPEIIITLEPHGVSGHLDHIAVSFITTFVFKKLQFVKELWYFCLTEEAQKVIMKYLGDYFIYFPPGYKKSEVTKTINISSVWEKKTNAIKKHESQKPDVQASLNTFTELPKEENFFILTKDTE